MFKFSSLLSFQRHSDSVFMCRWIQSETLSTERMQQFVSSSLWAEEEEEERSQCRCDGGVWWEEWCRVDEWTVCCWSCWSSWGRRAALLLLLSPLFHSLFLTVSATVIPFVLSPLTLFLVSILKTFTYVSPFSATFLYNLGANILLTPLHRFDNFSYQLLCGFRLITQYIMKYYYRLKVREKPQTLVVFLPRSILIKVKLKER